MTAEAFTQGTFYGGSAVLTTGTTLIGNIVSIDTAPEISRNTIETTVTATSGTGIKTYIAGDLKELGEVTITCQYSTQLDYNSLFGAPSTTSTGCDTITITFPKRGVTCGGALPTLAATWASPVVVTKLSPKFPLDSQMVIAMTFKVIGAPTFTAAVV